MATTRHKKVSDKTARNAAFVGVSATLLLIVLASMGQKYATTSRAVATQKSLTHCQALDAAVKAPSPPAPAEAKIVDIVKEARNACYKSLIEQPSFEGFQKKDDADVPTVSFASQFLFAPDSPGHFVYSVLLALFYTVLTICATILLIWFIESRGLTDSALGDVIEQFKKWFSPADSTPNVTSAEGALKPTPTTSAAATAAAAGGLVNVSKLSSSMTSSLGNVLAPLAISAPAILGVSLAAKAPTPSLEPAPSAVAVNFQIKPTVTSESPDIKVPFNFQPAVSGQVPPLQLPINIQPQIKPADTSISAPIPIAPSSVSVELPSLEKKLAVVYEELTNQRQKVPTVTVQTQDIGALVEKLDTHQQAGTDQFRALSNDLRMLAADAYSSVKSANSYAEKRDLAEQLASQKK